MDFKRRAGRVATLCAAMVFVVSGHVHAAGIEVMATQAVKAIYAELAPEFERSNPHRVSTAWVGSSDIMKRMKDGDVVDVVFLAKDSIDELVKLGKIVPGSRVDIANSGVGVAVRSGAPKPDISSGEVVKRAVLAAKSVAISSGSSSVHLLGLFQRMGIADEIASKLRRVATGLSVGEVIARGEADIGFQQVSELLPVAGITFVGPLPADIQHYTTYAGGIHTGARAPDAGAELLKFMKSPAALPVIRRAGMEPSGAP